MRCAHNVTCDADDVGVMPNKQFVFDGATLFCECVFMYVLVLPVGGEAFPAPTLGLLWDVIGYDPFFL